MKRFAMTIASLVAFGSLALAAQVRPAKSDGTDPFPNGKHPARSRSPGLEISRDPATGKVTVSPKGRGVLKQSPTVNGRFQPVRMRGAVHVAEPEAEQMLFLLEPAGGQVFSQNVVGYVNLQLPPGLSLVANPLRSYEDTLEKLINNPPDGAQVYKYVSGVGYEVSAYDALAQAWSNPDMDLSPGVGFFFNNTSPHPITNTFVGEVLQGILVNPLPAGFSTKGALVPQAGSINSIHHIPGQPGDVLRLYVNDLEGGGDYVASVFSDTENAWVPDLTLGVAQGFTSEKQTAMDWVRVFFAN